VDSSGLKDAQVQSYLPSGANVRHMANTIARWRKYGRTHCRHLSNNTEAPIYGGDAAYVKLL